MTESNNVRSANEEVAIRLRGAYNLILTANTSNINSYYINTQKALEYLAEALDILKEEK